MFVYEVKWGNLFLFNEKVWNEYEMKINFITDFLLLFVCVSHKNEIYCVIYDIITPIITNFYGIFVGQVVKIDVIYRVNWRFFFCEICSRKTGDALWIKSIKHFIKKLSFKFFTFLFITNLGRNQVFKFNIHS